MKSSKNLIKLLVIIFLAAGCNNAKIPESFDYGSVENGIYQNKFFGFKMKIPENWVVQSKEQIDNLTKSGKDLIAGDDEKMKAALKSSEVNTANLLAVFQYELGSAVNFNPNITVVAENIKNYPGIKNGGDYLFQSKKLMQQSQFKYDYVSDDFENTKINGTEFYKMETQLDYLGLEIKQEYYSSIIKGFSFNVILSYVNDEQKEILLNSLNSLKFKQ